MCCMKNESESQAYKKEDKRKKADSIVNSYMLFVTNYCVNNIEDLKF